MKGAVVKNTLAFVLLLSILFVRPALAADEGQTVGLFRNDPGAFQGYTLFTPRHYNTTYLIDMEGRLVHSWEADRRVEHALLLENGLLLRAVKTNLPKYERLPMVHGLLELVDWDGSVVWSFRYADDKGVLHHDFTALENGNFLMNSYESISREDAIAAGRNPDTIPADPVLAERILEVKPNMEEGGGEIVWTWTVWDHLIQDFDSTKENYGDVGMHPELFDVNYMRRPNRDLNHVNSVDYNEALDAIVISFHITDEIFVLDRSTTIEEAASSSGGRYGKGGDILYRFGNPRVYRAGTDADQRYNALHNAHWIPDGLKDAGKIMVLNNNFRGEKSVLELLELPIKQDGSFDMSQPAATTMVFDEFKTTNMGGAQRLPNGNTLVFESVEGRILEITPDKTVVWEYVNPVERNGPVAQGDAIPANPRSGDLLNEYFLAYRYAPDYPGLSGRELAPKGVIERPAGAATARQQSTDGPANLTAEQQQAYAAILEGFRVRRQAAFRQARGDRQKIASAMAALRQEQDKEVRDLLTDEQFAQYLHWMEQQGRQRRNR